MKLASFFLISVAFHAAILILPVSFFFEAGGGQVIPVALLRVEGDGEPGLAGKGRAERGRERTGLGLGRRRHAGMQRLETVGVHGASHPEETTKAADLGPLFVQEVSGEGVVTAGLGKVGIWETGELAIEGAKEGVGRGDAEIETGSMGQEGGGGSPALVFVQANYVHNPKPEYPERARREGWEGTVLLRVLVDQEGKSRRIEVSHSSGFETLDRAAIEAVKLWRFHPARYGERKVESWVKIPIIFRLADLENQRAQR